MGEFRAYATAHPSPQRMYYWHQLFCFVLLNTRLKLIPPTYGLNFCSHRRWAFLPHFLTSIQTPHLWYYWCTKQYGHVRAVFDSILNTFFLEFVQAQDLLGFVALGPRTPIFKNWVYNSQNSTFSRFSFGSIHKYSLWTHIPKIISLWPKFWLLGPRTPLFKNWV